MSSSVAVQEAVVMGEITSVAKNTKEFASLRTTIPMSMVRQWRLKPRDKLYWEWKVINGEMAAVVMKYDAASNKKQQQSSKK